MHGRMLSPSHRYRYLPSRLPHHAHGFLSFIGTVLRMSVARANGSRVSWVVSVMVATLAAGILRISASFLAIVAKVAPCKVADDDGKAVFMRALHVASEGSRGTRVASVGMLASFAAVWAFHALCLSESAIARSAASFHRATSYVRIG